MNQKLLISKIKIQQDLIKGHFEEFMDTLIADDRQLQMADIIDSELTKYHASINKLIDELNK